MSQSSTAPASSPPASASPASSNPPPATLGGRLSLAARDDLSDGQRALWDQMQRTIVPWAATIGFQSQTEDGRFIGPFNPLLRSPEIGQALLQFQGGETKASSLDNRVREVVILTVGAVWQPAFELYAHSVAARKLGFSPECIRALRAGEPSPELSAEEAVAQRLTLALCNEHHAPDSLYAEGVTAFGEQGMVDVTVLAGFYQLLSNLLNLFAVPAPDE